MPTTAQNGSSYSQVILASYAREDEALLAIFARLNADNKITLVSSRTEDAVTRQMQTVESAKSLLTNLKTARNILFDSGLPIKCSLIEDHRRHKLLYKYLTTDGEFKMCTMRSTDESHYLLEALDDLVSNFVLQLRTRSEARLS